MATVPLTFEGVRYGVLTPFSVRADAFTGYERTVLEGFGRTVGHAISAIERKQALVDDGLTELEIQVPDVVRPLIGRVTRRPAIRPSPSKRRFWPVVTNSSSTSLSPDYP